jgi:hypothetical protein
LGQHIGIWEYLRGRIALARGDLRAALEAFTAALRHDRHLLSARTLAVQICYRLDLGARASTICDLRPLVEVDVYRDW